MDYQKLVDLAFEATENCYVPYSKFKVGAALITKEGMVFKGCNIENAAYGSTMCAERNAVYGAYVAGVRRHDIAALAIVADCEPYAAPCGACRQVLCELLAQDTPIILANKSGNMRITNIHELLPDHFNGDVL